MDQEEKMLFADSEGVPVPRADRAPDGTPRKPDGQTLFDLGQANKHFGIERGRLKEIWLRSMKCDHTARAMDLRFEVMHFKNDVRDLADKLSTRKKQTRRVSRRQKQLAGALASKLASMRSEFSLELFLLSLELVELTDTVGDVVDAGAPNGYEGAWEDLEDAHRWLADARGELETASEEAAELRGITLKSFTGKRASTPVRKEPAGK